MTDDNRRLGVIADDFTGALDAGVQFVRAGLSTSLLLRPSRDAPVAVQVVSTDSRESDAAAAQQQVSRAAELLGGRAIFKKIDSTMRGHIGPEIEAALRATGLQRAVICPAAIEAGRTVQEGQLRVHGKLLHETDFANDPHWPARTSELIQLAGLPAIHLGLAVVRAGVAQLAQAIGAAPTPVVTVDAETHADLQYVAQAIVPSRSLPCGALGLARVWARELVGQARPQSEQALPGSRDPVLIVAGSRHPQTSAQVNALIAARDVLALEIVSGPERHEQYWFEEIARAFADGRSVVVCAPLEELPTAGDRQRLVAQLGVVTARICEACALGGLILTGGATASAICGQLGVREVNIFGELEVGVPWGRISSSLGDGCVLVTKAGGFGQTETLIRALDRLRA
jgi:uncharacterized protein YgbK (DUF1537 family)